jgi:predicted transcriptional regulator
LSQGGKRDEVILIVATIVGLLDGELLAGDGKLPLTMRGAVASDLLSEVLAYGQAGGVWFTLQTHLNVIAVARVRNLGAVILTGGHRPGPDVIGKAETEHIPLIATPCPTCEAIVRLCEAGLFATI